MLGTLLLSMASLAMSPQSDEPIAPDAARAVFEQAAALCGRDSGR